MRCPKCGSRFHVSPDGNVAAADDSAAPAVPKPGGAKPLSFPKPGAAKVPVPPRPTAPKPPSAHADDLDLPAPKGAIPKPSAPSLDADLPAPKKPAGPPKPSFGKKPIAPPVGGDDFDLDLPAPKGAAKKPIAPPVGGDDFDLDLPAPAGRSKQDELDLDLPAPKGPAKKPIAPPVGGDDFDLDLPAPRGAAPIADLPAPKAAAAPAPPADDGGLDLSDFDLDLPAPRAEPKAALADESRTPFDDLDLPAPRGAADLPVAKGLGFGDADLPAPRGQGGGFGDADLPAPKGGGFGEADLPRPKTRSVIEQADEAFGDLDLPMPKAQASAGGGFGDLDLPVPKGDADLPALRSGAFGDLDLPTPKTDFGAAPAAFGDLDLPTPKADADLPVLAGGADLPVAKASGDAFDDLALPQPRAMGGPEPEPDDMRDPAGRAGLGGTGFGELDLGAGGGDDDMEFADIPQESGETEVPTSGRDSLPPPRVIAKKKKAAKTEGGPKKSRALLVVAVGLVVLLAAGAGLAFTPYGLFGVYFFDQFLPGAGDPAQVRAAIQTAEEQASSDRWEDLRASLVTLGRARHDAGLNRELLARSLVHEGLYQVRFGEAGSSTRASGIRARLEERSAWEGPEYGLARAADALAQGQLAAVTPALVQARQHRADDPYVDLVAGELALLQGENDQAAEAFARAAENGAGARGLWGVARARTRGDDADATRAAIDAVLEASPHHDEAMVAKAGLLLDAGDADAAVALARQAIGLDPVDDVTLHASSRARARAWTLIGRVHERRGRVTQALEAFDQALAADDSHIPALLGAGRVMLADRPADAIARFESALQADGAATLVVASGRTAQQEAQLGRGRALLALDRVAEANDTLGALATQRQDDAEVLRWLGKAEESLEPPNNEAAEQHYRAAIQAAPETFPPYLALAQLFLSLDRASDAGAVLEQAQARVPESAEMRYELGAFEIRRNQLPAAIRELTRALVLEPELPPALFSLGVAYRRSGQLSRAEETFEHLARVDTGHPGLALERGLLFEARGESQRAVEAYRAALEEQPDDMDLLLRLGAAQVAARQIDDAEQTLERVRQARPNSPEASHFVGRVAFARGRYAEALTHFRQAVRLDPSRGEFHLYVGWAALENGQLGEALRGVDDAIERDPSLGDAFWIRGEVEQRTGRPRPALEDLRHALELSPGRAEIHAVMGEAYNDTNDLSAAIASYERAVQAIDDNGEWWYRLGRLQMDRGNRAEASRALARATLLGDALTPVPGWLADAHRLLADTQRLAGQRSDAVVHYRRYLELAPLTAIDRRDVRRIMMDLGEVPPPE